MNIPKAGKPGETRPLGIPALRDRVLMSAAKLILEPIFEADFSPASFGFRPKRSAHDALEVIRQTANSGAHWVLERHNGRFAPTEHSNKNTLGLTRPQVDSMNARIGSPRPLQSLAKGGRRDLEDPAPHRPR